MQNKQTSTLNNFGPVMPNFVKTVLFAAIAATSLSAFADNHATHEEIGELKDMTTSKTEMTEEAVSSALPSTDDASIDAAADIEDAAMELIDESDKVETPELKDKLLTN